MTKQEVINYITKTPGNTNPAVLSTILNEFGVSDNKQEIELSATENKVYTPAEGKVYNKVTVNVPAPVSDWTSATVTVENNIALYQGSCIMPVLTNNNVAAVDVSAGGTYTVPLYKGVAIAEYSGLDTPVIYGDITDNSEQGSHTLTITGDGSILWS